MVEHGWIDEAAFEKFTFTNPARFYTGTNPALLQGHRGRVGRRPPAGRGLTCSTCCSGAAPWSTAPGAAPVVADVGIRDGRIVAVGAVDEPAPGHDRRRRQGGVPRLRRHPHPLRRPAAVGPHGQPVGPARGHHGARRELRVLHRPARTRRRRLHPADDGGGRGDPPRGPRRRRARGTGRSFGEYLDRVDVGLAVNAGFLVGHSTVRRVVMGDARHPGPGHARTSSAAMVAPGRGVAGRRGPRVLLVARRGPPRRRRTARSRREPPPSTSSWPWPAPCGTTRAPPSSSSRPSARSPRTGWS